MQTVTLSFLLSVLVLAQGAGSDPQIVGVWKPVNYHLSGKDHPMEGLLIFRDGYFSANVRYQQSSTELDDSNANAGTYRTEGNKLILTSALAGHIRPGKKEEPIHYNRGGIEEALYEIRGEKLIITFPSKNRYEAERLK